MGIDTTTIFKVHPQGHQNLPLSLPIREMTLESLKQDPKNTS